MTPEGEWPLYSEFLTVVHFAPRRHFSFRVVDSNFKTDTVETLLQQQSAALKTNYFKRYLFL